LSCGRAVGLACDAHIVFGRRIDRLEAQFSRFVGAFGAPENRGSDRRRLWACGGAQIARQSATPVGCSGGVDAHGH